MLQVTFPEIARVLGDMRSSVPAAESHGCMCGALCAASNYSLERWFEEIVPEEVPDTPLEDNLPLKLLFEDTVRALRGDEMQFEPLLPDDEVALQERARALSQWCQGFLYGFGTAVPPQTEDIPANVDEILRDLTHIGRATVELAKENDEENDEEEQAYAEVIEYVRVGVQLIHDELQSVKAAKGSDKN
jgi:uncharacterized protein YgfB (UPF0149 family)